MKSEKINRVYSCCGQYIAVKKSLGDQKVSCPRCGNVLTVPLRIPTIVLFYK